MDITEERDLDMVVFRLNGRLDTSSAPDFDRRIEKSLDTGSKRLIIDCRHLDYITSAGLRVLNKTAKRLKREAGKVVLFAMMDDVREVFEIAGFDTFLPIVATFDEAKSVFGDAPDPEGS